MADTRWALLLLALGSACAIHERALEYDSTGGTSDDASTGGTSNDASTGGTSNDAGCTLTLCDTDCVDLTNSTAHCGTCGHACSTGQSCYAGTCCPTAAAGGVCSLPACGCADGEVCYPSSSTRAMGCFVSSNQPIGSACGDEGPGACAAGLGCVGGLCRQYCTDDASCTRVDGARQCDPATWSDGSEVAGVKVCRWICDPAHPQNPQSPLQPCPPGYGCDSAANGATICYVAASDNRVPCTTMDECMPGYFCDSIISECAKYCMMGVAGDCPTGDECLSFVLTRHFAGTREIGYCGVSIFGL